MVYFTTKHRQNIGLIMYKENTHGKDLPTYANQKSNLMKVIPIDIKRPRDLFRPD